MADPLLSYLTLLAGPTPGQRLLEIRYRTNGRPGMGQTFVPAIDTVRASEVIRPLGAHGDTYVGVLLRDRPEGGRDAVSTSHLLWVELDAPDAHMRLTAAPAPPSAVVSSGTQGHLHCYWLLSGRVDATLVPELNRKLAGAVGGDLASVDSARILRPPSSLNHKYEPPAATVLELLDATRVYDPFELAAGLEDPRPKPVYLPPAPKPRRPGARRSSWELVDDELRQIPTLDYLDVLLHQQPNNEGKIRCPFHGNGQERTPSLQIYPPYEWACFGCGRGGSIYDFASHQFGIPTKGPGFRELHDRLADIFGIVQSEPLKTQTPVPAAARFHA